MFALPERHLSRYPVPIDAQTRSSSTVGGAAVADYQGGMQVHLVQALVLGRDHLFQMLGARAERTSDNQV